MVASKLEVMDQSSVPGGHETCGYHTFKNSMLTLMFRQGIIAEDKYKLMLKDKALFDAVFKATKQLQKDGTCDLSVPLFMKLLDKAKNGELDFTAHGITKENLSSLNLNFDGTENISVSNYLLYPGAPEHGLSGTEEDLFAAAAVAKLARTKGVASHVFASGLTDPNTMQAHWITAEVTQNAKGERTWKVMDSWQNQSKFLNTVVNKIERILKKSEPELKAYLRDVYDESSSQFNLRYNNCFEANGTAKPEAIAKLIADKNSMEQLSE